MSILVDTNILLRRTQPDHPSHPLAVESVAGLLNAGEPVYFTLQNMAEFWSVATRPTANNGLGLSVAFVVTSRPVTTAARNTTTRLPKKNQPPTALTHLRTARPPNSVMLV
jgi:predicted nucleic acid-binding protein